MTLRPTARSPSPAAPTKGKKAASKKIAAIHSGEKEGDGSDSIYLYGHIPDASSFLSQAYRFSVRAPGV
jgi:hypothetical protein